MNNPKVDLSVTSVLKVLAVVLLLWVAYYIRDILVLVFVVVLLTAALDPLVDRISHYKIPRVISILIIYLVLALVVGVMIYAIIPPLVSQVRDLATNLPYYLERVTDLGSGSKYFDVQKIIDSLISGVSKLSGGLLNATISVFSGVVGLVTVLALTFYSLIDEQGITSSVVEYIPVKNRDKVVKILRLIGLKIGMWLRGQLTLMLVIGATTSVGLMILQVPYALALGVLAGLLEIIPVVGPIIAGLAAILIGFLSGLALWQLIAILALFVLIQQLENSVLVPKIMQKAIGVSPVVIIVAILIGSKLLGTGGAVLSIPIVAILSVIAKEYSEGFKFKDEPLLPAKTS